ncbi:helix-turn-helix domain-containing protein [Actinokineospora auranticolor]|uniref:helix-turn-helix domain-containing protein n=1 Tax=Actinokineospora auranticolor TaxID=155976 RepID=UPI001FE92994|nr:helix-turn-helix domain-containing protein [Actinokineospora auranticolor]
MARSRPQTTPHRTRQPEHPPPEPAVDPLLLFTAEQAAAILQVRPSWLRRKAAARAIPCRYVGKHLRFSRDDIIAITAAAATGKPAR